MNTFDLDHFANFLSTKTFHFATLSSSCGLGARKKNAGPRLVSTLKNASQLGSWDNGKMNKKKMKAPPRYDIKYRQIYVFCRGFVIYFF